MSKLPYSLTISNVANATKLVDWCSKCIKTNEWDLKIFPSRPIQYTIYFASEQNKLLASLMS